MDNDEIPAIELKGEGQHGIMYCSPSPHADGSNYGILGKRHYCLVFRRWMIRAQTSSLLIIIIK